MSDQQKLQQQLMQAQQQLQMQQKLQETIQHLTDLCWEKCMKQPGSSMSSSEERCFQNCALRYRDVSQLVMEKLQSVAQNM
mmetsp:Transcript_51015/g.84701  ORF Transcript_51015/g.84701 Transcript_51015/m.84701 type:complete len:81 (+) Transcript_51015:139-381(+)